MRKESSVRGGINQAFTGSVNCCVCWSGRGWRVYPSPNHWGGGGREEGKETNNTASRQTDNKLSFPPPPMRVLQKKQTKNSGVMLGGWTPGIE